jgi:peptide/nickel transport system substrate-binding protein/oligopeptide transport system substrate-binding protein
MRRQLVLPVLIACSTAVFLGLTLSGRPRSSAAAAHKLRIPIPVNPSSLDPVELGGIYEIGVAERIYSTLVRHSPQLTVVPDLAESWAVSPDGLTYTFRLRAGARFHNGREMTAADALWSLNRLADPRVSRKLDLVEEVAGVRQRREKYKEFMEARRGRDLSADERAELDRMMDPSALPGLSAPGVLTLVMKLRRPWPPQLHLLAMVQAAVVPREEVERPGQPFARRPCGTGPFRLSAWSDNERIYLDRFDRHFAGLAMLEAVEYLVIREPAMAFKRYERGELDMCEIPLGRLREVAGRPDHRSWPQLATFFLGISMKKQPLADNVHLRRALNLAVDRERLCRVVLEGRAVPARGPLPPGMPGYREDLEGYVLDRAAARRELDAAGYPEGPDGRGLPPLAFCYSNNQDGRRLALELQGQFAATGIPIELNAVEFNQLKAMTLTDPPPLFRWSWSGDYPDPDNFLHPTFHSSCIGGSNRVHFASAGVDALIEAARALPGGRERLAAYGRAEDKVIEECPWVFLYHPSAHLLVRPEVRGLTFTPLDGGTDLCKADLLWVWKDRP